MIEVITPADVRSAASDLAVDQADAWLTRSRHEQDPIRRDAMLEATAAIASLARQIMRLPIANDAEAA